MKDKEHWTPLSSAGGEMLSGPEFVHESCLHKPESVSPEIRKNLAEGGSHRQKVSREMGLSA